MVSLAVTLANAISGSAVAVFLFSGNTIEQSEDNDFEYIKVVKATSAIKKLFITSLFNPEVELVK